MYNRPINSARLGGFQGPEREMEINWANSETFNLEGESGNTLTIGHAEPDLLVHRWNDRDGKLVGYNVRLDDDTSLKGYLGEDISARYDDLIGAWLHLCKDSGVQVSEGDIAITADFLKQTRGQGVLHTRDFRRAKA